jgi:hypothetical protein
MPQTQVINEMAPITNEIVNTYELGPDKEKVQHEISLSRKGEKAVQGYTTNELIEQHYRNLHHIEECLRDANARWAKQITIPHAYPPSLTPLEQLNQVCGSRSFINLTDKSTDTSILSDSRKPPSRIIYHCVNNHARLPIFYNCYAYPRPFAYYRPSRPGILR